MKMSSSEQTSSTANEEHNAETIIRGKTTDRKFKDLKPKLLYNGILVAGLVAFGLFGGFVFKKCETASVGFEKNPTQNLPTTGEFLQDLINEKKCSHDPQNNEKWQNPSVEKLEEYINRRMELESNQQEPLEWKFSDSWLFACTIFTTIGYGNIAPLSAKGRIFCILYAAIGIPLFSVVAGSLASLITDIVHTCHAEYHRRKQKSVAGERKKDDGVTSTEFESQIPELEIKLKHIAIACLGYLCLGASFFSLGEGWSPFESFYYCFITLSTVGLGDYVPGHVHHTSLFGIYILVGLVLVIMLFGALEDAISRRCQKLKDKLKIVD